VTGTVQHPNRSLQDVVAAQAPLPAIPLRARRARENSG
jgi:hypothetical protein